MSENNTSELWSTSSNYFADEGDSRHALPVETSGEQPETSYGLSFEHPPYATDDAPMTVDMPSVSAPVVPSPRPADVEQRAHVSGLESVTCPECGATQEVHLNRRESVDFCRRCDYPLFWVPSRVTQRRGPGGAEGALRRLPGTGGSTRLASLACPHCAERNPVTAETCSRCGQSMRIVAPPPRPLPPPPVRELPPAPEPEPEPRVAWWVWLLLALLIIGVLIGALALVGVF